MAHYQLFEWEARRFDADDAIPVGDAERLVNAARVPAARLKGKQRAFDFGREALTAQNLVGVVAAGEASCEILPKVDRDAAGESPRLRQQLIRMLSVAYDVPVADDVATTLATQNDTMLEVLIARFAAMLGEAVRRGMPRAYIAHCDDLPALRGRLDVTRQFTTLAASPQRLACRYDEFSDDIPLNQILKAAVTQLRALSRSHTNQRALSELALLYADVTAVPRASLAWHAIVPDRNNMRWMALVRLAKLVLGERFQNSAGGPSDGFALLFDMNVLFERYVEKLLEPLARGQGWMMQAQGGARDCLHPEDGTSALFATYPDIQLRRNGQIGLVVDTKWKRLIDRSRDRKMDVSQADIYQLMAYAQLYRCERLVLLYPHHGGLASPMPVHHRVASPDGLIRLTVATVDLSSHGAARAGLASLLTLLALGEIEGSALSREP